MPVAVIPLAEDETERSFLRLRDTIGLRDFVFCLDEDSRLSWPERYGHVVRCRGFGLGKALEEGFRYAFRELGAEWAVKTDNHVEFLRPAREMLRPEWGRYVILPGHYTPEGVLTYGLYVDWLTWDWRWSYQPWRLLPCCTDPVYAIHRRLAELLWSRQPYCFMVPYWGKEALDLTLTLARLGHPVYAVDSVRVVHHYKKSWPKTRVARRCLEPWCCLLYTSPSPRDLSTSRMPSSA